jgi:hypothetical protein
MQIRVVISGRNYDALAALPERLDVADGAKVADALAAVGATLPAGTTLPKGCLVALSGRHLGTVTNHANMAIRDGDELLLIAPVAGG